MKSSLTVVFVLLLLPSPLCAQVGIPLSDARPELVQAWKELDNACLFFEPSMIQSEDTSLCPQLESALDLFFEGPSQEAEPALLEAIAQLQSQPERLDTQSCLPPLYREALATLIRIQLARARFDEAESTARTFAATFPLFNPSRKAFPPEVVDLIEQARAQLVSSAFSLTWLPELDSSCSLRLNGESIQPTEHASIPLAPQEHVISLQCEELHAGPYSFRPSHRPHPIALNRSSLNALLYAPRDYQQQRALASLLALLFDAESLVLLSSNEQHDLLMLLDHQRFVVIAGPHQEHPDVSEMLYAAHRLDPTPPFLLDQGYGFEIQEDSTQSFIAEAIAVSVSSAVLLSGVVLYFVASSLEDDVKACDLSPCPLPLVEQRLNSHANTLMSSHVLMLGGGVALAVSSVFLTLALLPEDEPIAPLAIACFADSCSASWTWRW
ncbi:MAG: hypothetical protein RBU37_28015 [Myxococcota bacterium]|nr:hypothetical protein [Myxococcota bacterium]